MWNGWPPPKRAALGKNSHQRRNRVVRGIDLDVQTLENLEKLCSQFATHDDIYLGIEANSHI